IILGRPHARFEAEIGCHHLAQRRAVGPGAVQVLKERHVDLVEHLLARPVQFDYKLGDERAPVDGIEALAAAASPGLARSPASIFRPPACSITTGSAATSSAMVIGRSKNSSRVSLG